MTRIFGSGAVDGRMVVDFSSLYLTRGSVKRGAFVATFDRPRDELVEICRGERSDSRVHARWDIGGAVPHDVVHVSEGVSLLLSSSVVSAMRSANLTGFDAVPCELTDKHDEIHEFWFLVVLGRCGPIDDSRSVLVEKDYPGGRVPAMQGVYFPETSWDGSNVFCPEPSRGTVFMDRKAREAMESVKQLKGATFTPLTEFCVNPPLH